MKQEKYVRSRVMSQLLLRIVLVINILGLITVTIVYFLLTKEYQDNQLREINTVSKVVVEAMESAHKASKTVEFLIDAHLQTVSEAITQKLRGKSVESISLEELHHLKQSYDLAGISLFVNKGDDIVVAKSTDEKEVGLSSKDWGYWYTAFQQLMNQEKVTVDKGFSSDHYWVGPISRSEWEKKYYKYAYYFDGSTQFMINPYMAADKVYQLSIESGPNQLIKQITNESALIDQIAVINVSAFLKGEDNKVIEPDYDLPVLFGKLEGELPENNALLKEVSKTKQMQSIQFKHQGKFKNNIYLPLPQDRVMVVTIDLTDNESKRMKLLTVIIAGHILLMLLLYVIIKAVTRRQLRPLQQIAEHIVSISEGDLSKTLKIHENNEWDLLADKISLMTESMGQLILQIKNEIHSLHVLSSLLSHRVYNSMNKMNTITLTMTEESKSLLHELDAYGDTLREFVQVLSIRLNQRDEAQAQVNDADLVKSLDALVNKIEQLSALSTSHSDNLSEITISFYDWLGELQGIIDSVDQLSEELKEKIGIFRLSE